MNSNLRKWCVCLLAAGGLCQAQAQNMYDEIREGAYMGIDGGGAILQNFKLSSEAFGLNNAKAKPDAGGAFDIYFGYQFNQYFALEANTGFVFNRIDRVGDLPVDPDRLDIWQTPLMANAVFTLPIRGPVRAYAGAGAGGVFTTMDLDLVDFGTVRDTDATFGYQAFAGLKFAITEVTDIGVGYKFMSAGKNDWNDAGVDLRSDRLYTHLILATFTFRF